MIKERKRSNYRILKPEAQIIVKWKRSEQLVPAGESFVVQTKVPLYEGWRALALRRLTVMGESGVDLLLTVR
jgi:hypothetical protein